MLKETVTDTPVPSHGDGDTARQAAGDVPRAMTGTAPVRVTNPRVIVGEIGRPRADLGPAARRVRGAFARQAAGSAAIAASTPATARASSPARRRFDAPERLVPILVAVFLVIATLTAAPAVVGVTGATTVSDGAARLVVGGDQGPNGALAAGVDGVDWAGPDAPIDGPTANGASIEAAAPGDADVAGQFLDDGTLLKPVVVETNVADSKDRLRSYKVRSGDTLTGIARRMGVSMMTIWWANKLKTKDDLHVGQALVIPPVDGLILTAKAGDTLDTIARAKGIDPDEVAAYNNLTDRTLVIGQVIILPGALGRGIPTPKPTHRAIARVPSSGGGASRGSPGSRPVIHNPGQYNGGVFGWPVPGGHISQYYSYGHPAIDIAAPVGTPIVAAAGGAVIYASWKSNGGGYQVWIAHGSGLYTTYNHMSSVSVGVGQHVGRGQFLGRVGSTGNSTGPHCHFEVWRGPVWSGGVRVNPLAYL